MFKYLRLIPTAGARIVIDDLRYFRSYQRHPDRYTIEEKWRCVQATVRYIYNWVRGDLRVQGLENIKELKEKNIKALYVGNHMSFLDPITLIALFDEPLRMVGKKEVRKLPIVGRFLETIDGLFMDREDLKQSLKIILECTKTLKENKMDVVIFPEGTRNKEPETTLPATYHVGSFKAATKVGAPIVPFCLYGTFRGLAKKPDFRTNPIEFVVGKPIYKEEYEKMTPEELVEKVHKWTCDTVLKLQAFDRKFIEEKKNKIPYRKTKKLRQGKFYQNYDFDNDKSLD